MAVQQQNVRQEPDDDITMNGLRGCAASATGKRGQSSRCPSGVRVPSTVSRECFYIIIIKAYRAQQALESDSDRKREEGSQPASHREEKCDNGETGIFISLKALFSGKGLLKQNGDTSGIKSGTGRAEVDCESSHRNRSDSELNLGCNPDLNWALEQ